MSKYVADIVKDYRIHGARRPHIHILSSK